MCSLESIFCPPLAVKGLKELDRSLFVKSVSVPAIAMPSSRCNDFLHRFRTRSLKYQGLKKIVPGPTENERLLLLLPEDVENGQLNDDDLLWIKSNNGNITRHEVRITYDDYTIGNILKAVLPPDEVKDIPSSFETIGHIAHLNLRDDQEPYKELIGQVLLDKLANIKTVVNKLSSIDETYRTFKMEVLAGEKDTNVAIRENGCTFRFDFSKVYWNSRLHTEHKRIVDALKPGDVVLDMFAGVGPFAVPAAKKNCRVFANDLNPSSYQALLDNVRSNNVSLKAFNLDGRDFIHKVKGEVASVVKETPTATVHVMMNLPSLAIEFLDCLKGLYNGLVQRSEDVLQSVPLVHCYAFSKSPTPEEDVLGRIQQVLEVTLESYEVFNVRDVSPNKLMMRVTFALPCDILFSGIGMKHSRTDYSHGDNEGTRDIETPAAKKNCPV